MASMRVPPQAPSSAMPKRAPPLNSRGAAGGGAVLRREAIDAFEAAAEAKKAALPTLQRGSTGPLVKKLQDRLVRAKCMAQADVSTGPGVYGPRTEQAVRRFQEQAGLPVTGVAGGATMAALLAMAAPAKAAPAVREQSSFEPSDDRDIGHTTEDMPKSLADDAVASSTHPILSSHNPGDTLTDEPVDSDTDTNRAHEANDE